MAINQFTQQVASAGAESTSNLPNFSEEIDLATHVHPLIDVVRYACEASSMIDELKATNLDSTTKDIVRVNTPGGHGEIQTTVSEVLWTVQRLLYAYEEQRTARAKPQREMNKAA